MRISDWSSDVCSSDLRDLRPVGGHVDKLVPAGDVAGRIDTGSGGPHPLVDPDSPVRRQSYAGLLQAQPSGVGLAARSEEHTSELQSLMRISYAVFCLKKKNINNNIIENTEAHIKNMII